LPLAGGAALVDAQHMAHRGNLADPAR
jgi:hypothetical protein